MGHFQTSVSITARAGLKVFIREGGSKQLYISSLHPTCGRGQSWLDHLAFGSSFFARHRARLSEEPFLFTPSEVGQVKAHLYHGLGPPQIAGSITKADGETLGFPQSTLQSTYSQRYSLR